MRAEVVAALKVTFQTLKLSLQGQFMLNHSQQGLLNIAGQIIEAADSHGRSVKSDSPEAVVLAREQHLEKATKIRLIYLLRKTRKIASDKSTYSWKERAPSLSESKNLTRLKSSLSVAVPLW
jgi:hypothetical protein